MGFNPWLVSYIRKAHFSGLGNISYKLKYTNVKKVKIDKFKFNLFQYYLLKLFRGSI
jgi:hypothetical protein